MSHALAGVRYRRHTRRRPLRLTAAVLGITGACLVPLLPGEAPARAASCPTSSTTAPIVGSWYTQTKFPGAPFPGRTENGMQTFTPGGGVVEANPVNPSPAANSGSWRLNADCSYSLSFVEFTYDTTDPVPHGIDSVVVVNATYVLDDQNHLHSTKTDAALYTYDPETGARKGDPTVMPNVSNTTGVRFTTSWTPPNQFPPQQ